MEEQLCRCGTDRFAPLVVPSPVFGAFGWFLLVLGATPKPLRVEYRCSRCNHYFGYTTDPEVLKKVN